MSPEHFTKSYPELYHMAAESAWPSIRRYGLLSTKALLDLFEISGTRRQRILGCHRDSSITIRHVKYGSAVIRDQKPMSDRGLVRSLPRSVTPKDWYRLLNSKVFFWATSKRLETLLQARTYRNIRHLVLVVDTSVLVGRYSDSISVTTMNTGATKPIPHPRDYTSFVRLSEFDYERSKRKRGKSRAIAEVTIDYSVDILNAVKRAEHRMGSRTVRRIYESDLD